MRALLGTAAELLREIFATVDIRIRRAPPSLWIAWIAAVVLVLVGVIAATQIGRGTESANPDGPTIGLPDDTTTTTDTDEDRPDRDPPAVDADGPATSTITGELGAMPAGSTGSDHDDAADTTLSTRGDSEPTSTTAPTSAPTTITTIITTTAPARPDEGNVPQGLLGAILDLLSSGP